ncbi:MAG: triose-phosphate isomerase, partial [Synergistaceae bacterium]|nr:triose-phosphate isomerase [Synergistaceae bacterium]
EIFSQPSIDGGLIGGASLKADEFLDILMNYRASCQDL